MPTLKDRLNADLKTAMLARDQFTTETLRGLKAAILNEEVATGTREQGLGDEDVEKLLMRESKKRLEAAELFEKGGNQASADKERKEAELISNYLPQQLSEGEIQKLVDEAVADIQPEGIKDMGRVIGAVKAKAGNSADGALVARLVKEKLQ
ncbi:MAG TPA: GatB/YqeY domain-containing protein [Candidatus Saccharimonadales bacterium]|nr:GatB/YqeY domain-containing protein [Candidatus Saccharimonadales bacterium]